MASTRPTNPTVTARAMMSCLTIARTGAKGFLLRRILVPNAQVIAVEPEWSNYALLART